MTAKLSIIKPPTSIWLVGVSFVLFQFFLQLSSAVIIGSIMLEMHLSALMTGILASAFYYVYTSLQIPVGLLFDKREPRFLLCSAALVCAMGCFFFAHSHSLLFLLLNRLIIGAGAAFAFIGLSHLLRFYYPARLFAFMIGLSETLGFFITMIGIASLGFLIHHCGWRYFINLSAVIGVFIAYSIWRIIPSTDEFSDSKAPPSQSPHHSLDTDDCNFLSPTRKPICERDIPKNHVDVKSVDLLRKTKQNFSLILGSRALWLNGLFVGLSFTVVTVFGAMWAIPFIQSKLACSLKEASIADSMLFLGAAISCPLFGYLAEHFKQRRLIMLFSSLSTALLLLVTLFISFSSLLTMSFLMFLIGLFCGAYMLSYSIANELAPKDTLSTCTGFTNTLAMLTAPLFQPLIGFLLDLGAKDKGLYLLFNYQCALLIIPISLFISAILVFYLPEKLPEGKQKGFIYAL